jgi:hypothetical protein
MIASVRDRLSDVLRAVGLRQGRGRLGENTTIQSDMEEIGVLSRVLVQASMDAAHGAHEQRQQVLAVVRIEERIRASAMLNLEKSQAASAQTDGVARDLDAVADTMGATNRSMEEMVRTVTAGAAMMQEFVHSMRRSRPRTQAPKVTVST